MTFWVLHWTKGQPYWGDGKLDKLTFWEQIDNGPAPIRPRITRVPLDELCRTPVSPLPHSRPFLSCRHLITLITS